MRSQQLAATLLAGCAARATADAPAAAVSANAKADELVSAPTNGKKNGHRLLQKFKTRRERLFDSRSRNKDSDNADLGVLKSGTPRFLQDDNDYDYYCPEDSCPSELCECANSGGSLEDCTPQLEAVCRAGKLGDCVFKDYVQVYEEVYCPFVACVGEGFRENQCDCAFYELYCERLQGAECEEVVGVASDEPDKKPFFGCDEAELASVCDEAKSCKTRGDLQGLPELGEWKGSVLTGLPKSSGERMGVGGIVAGGAALLSTLWLMVNV